MSNTLELVRLSRQQPATHCVIWLHGLGADGNDFVPVAKMLKFPPHISVEFIFPHAPQMAVTINNGMHMRAWYDIAHPDLNHQPDLKGIELSTAIVLQLIQQQLDKGMSTNKILLAGFSQGGVIALNIATGSKLELAGVLALSTYLPTALLAQLPTPQNNSAILQMHGEHDPVVPLSYAQNTHERIAQLDRDIAFKTYPMAHEVTMEQISDINDWMVKRLL